MWQVQEYKKKIDNHLNIYNLFYSYNYTKLYIYLY